MRVEVFPSFSSHENALSWATTIIEIAAQTARGRYLTLTPGQDAAYAAKLADAKAYLADPANPSDYPWVSFEAAATGVVPFEAAQKIIAAAETWQNVTGPSIEAARIAGKLAVKEARTVPELCRAAREAEKALNDI